MGFISRSAFDLGWVPNADKLGAPSNALLRADNLTLDEFGVVAVRPGAQTVATLGGDVHSLFTSYIAGTRYRMAGVANSVYANGMAIANALAGANDVFFGFQLGQILFARSTAKLKYDGATVRNWGIAMNGAKPSATPATADGKTLATGAESTGGPLMGIPWYKVEAAAPNGTIAFGPNHYQVGDPLYNAVGAVKLELAPTKRAVYELDFGSDRDYSVYDGGTAGDDEDLVSLYLWMSDPRQMTSFHLQASVNTAWWDKDLYVSPDAAQGILRNDNLHRLLPAPGQTLPPLPPGTVTGPVTGTAVPRLAGTAPPKLQRVGHTPPSYPVGGLGSGGESYPNAGWMHLQWRRGDFVRQGTTADKGWNSVRSIRLVVEASAQDFVARVDTIRMFGGAITGTARFRYVYVRDNGVYQAKSAMSPASDMALFDHQAAQVAIPSDSSRDSQVNQIWLYRFDESMDTYYRTAVANASGTGPLLVTDSMKARDALEANLPIEIDNAVPPDNIVGIVGPHYDRTLVLTSDGQLWSSRRLDPDAFATGQVVQVCGSDDTPLWIYKAVTEVFIGTTKDIYRLEGDGGENPDGSTNYALRGLNMDHRPLNEAVAHEGNQIVFFSDDGWRAFDGSAGSANLTGATSLLYRGYTRHGVLPVNVATGRFRAALGMGKLIAITPEGASTTSSSVLYRHEFASGRWWRHPYAPLCRSIMREKDGTVLVGTTTGAVLALDVNQTTGDDAAAIPIVLWTRADHCEMPYQRKKVGALTWRSDSNGVTESIAVHLNGSDVAATTLSATNASAAARTIFDLGNPFLTNGVTPNPQVVAICRQMQWRVTASVFTYRLYDFSVQFRERPAPMIGRVSSVLAGSQGVKIISGFMVRCCTLGVARRFTAILDGTADAETFDITTDVEESSSVPLLFTLTGRRATDVQLAVDGELELDNWSTITTQEQPVGVKIWDSGPILDNPRERSWLRALEFKVRAGADLVVTPYFDGVAFPPVHITVTPNADTVYRIPVGRAYVGRQPRIVVESCDTFYPYFVQAIRRDSGEPSQKSKVRQAMRVSTP